MSFLLFARIDFFNCLFPNATCTIANQMVPAKKVGQRAVALAEPSTEWITVNVIVFARIEKRDGELIDLVQLFLLTSGQIHV